MKGNALPSLKPKFYEFSKKCPIPEGPVWCLTAPSLCTAICKCKVQEVSKCLEDLGYKEAVMMDL